jgi:hypothetical protein
VLILNQGAALILALSAKAVPMPA